MRNPAVEEFDPPDRTSVLKDRASPTGSLGFIQLGHSVLSNQKIEHTKPGQERLRLPPNGDSLVGAAFASVSGNEVSAGRLYQQPLDTFPVYPYFANSGRQKTLPPASGFAPSSRGFKHCQSLSLAPITKGSSYCTRIEAPGMKASSGMPHASAAAATSRLTNRRSGPATSASLTVGKRSNILPSFNMYPRKSGDVPCSSAMPLRA